MSATGENGEYRFHFMLLTWADLYVQRPKRSAGAYRDRLAYLRATYALPVRTLNPHVPFTPEDDQWLMERMKEWSVSNRELSWCYNELHKLVRTVHELVCHPTDPSYFS